MRIRIHFSKTEAMRFTGHLDLQRAWERCIRRAGLPLAYSQGFRQHPRINLGSALPLGFTSQDEVVDIWLEEDLPLEQIDAALRCAAPPGIQLNALTLVDERAPALQSLLQAAEYEIALGEPLPDLATRLEQLCRTDSLPRQRRGKSYDLRPLVLTLQPLPENPSGQQRLLVVLSARENATGRPEEVLLALGCEPAQARIHRTRLIFQ